MQRRDLLRFFASADASVRRRQIGRATQQGVAGRFHKLGLIPKPIAIRDIVWRNAQT
jgi:hypothetical protein